LSGASISNEWKLQEANKLILRNVFSNSTIFQYNDIVCKFLVVYIVSHDNSGSISEITY
jgi:hypothetical protein